MNFINIYMRGGGFALRTPYDYQKNIAEIGKPAKCVQLSSYPANFTPVISQRVMENNLKNNLGRERLSQISNGKELERDIFIFRKRVCSVYTDKDHMITPCFIFNCSFQQILMVL